MVWPMEEEPSEPDLQKPRYLLPEGCSDLNDVIRREEESAAKAGQKTPLAEEEKRPALIAISEPIQAGDLAQQLGVKSYQVVSALIALKIFGTQDTWLNFDTAAAVGAKFGVSVIKAGSSGPEN